MSNYTRGKTYEYKLRDKLRAAGWFVIQAGGSKGVADLVALKYATAPVLVQAKNRPGPLSPAERTTLLQLALSLGATPIHAHPGTKRGTVQWRQLTGQHADSFTIWSPDDV